MNDYNKRSAGPEIRGLLSINDPRWGRGAGGEKPPADGAKRPKGGEGPPDLDEMWREFNRRLSGLFRGRGGKGGGGRPGSGRTTRVGAGLIVGALAAVYLGSGVFIVQEGQTGVVLQFGQYKGSVAQGVHWRLPYPVESHWIVNTAQVHSVDIGRTTLMPLSNMKDASMLTRDGEIVDVRFTVQYRIQSPSDYLFRVVDPERSVAQAGQAAIREIAGARSASEMLGQDREAVRQQLTTALQRDLDHAHTGLTVLSVTVQDVQPPELVRPTFAKIVKARQERERLKLAARAEADELMPRARGDAEKMIIEAKTYADRIVVQARGDAERFKQVYAQYVKAPAVIRERMYLETMQQIYASTTKVYAGNRAGNNVLYLPLDKLIEQERQRASEAAAANSVAAAPAVASASAPSETAKASSRNSEPLRSREGLRSRVREDDVQ